MKLLITLLLFIPVSVFSQTIFTGWPASRSGFASTKVNGNTFFYTTASNWNKSYKSKFVKYEIRALKSGWYNLQANVIAANGSDNSFFVGVNQRFPSLWSIPVSSKAQYRTIDNKIYLKKGINEINFYPRENHTKVADVRAVFIANVVPDYHESFSGKAPANMLNTRSNQEGLWVTKWDALKATYRPNHQGSPRLLWSSQVVKANEYTLSYKVKFNDGFDFAAGGKLHGMGPDLPSSGCQAITANGWSNRAMFGRDGGIFLYLYHQNRTNRCGHGYSSNNNFKFKTGRWYTVSIYTKLNSSASKSDGVAKLYVNGKQLVAVENVKFRNSNASASMISKFLFSTFFGGNSYLYSPSHKVSAYFDDFQMVRGDYPR